MKKEEFIIKYGEVAYTKRVAQTKAWHEAHPEACKRARVKWDKAHPGEAKAKSLYSRSFEGVVVYTHIRTKNNYKSWHLWSGFSMRRGYRGTYKGKGVTYDDALEVGKIRHHDEYFDEDQNKGVICVSLKEHTNIHRGEGGRIYSHYLS